MGKKAAIVEANRSIRKTLRPCLAESVDWDTTENLYIEGDNLEVLKLLQESYLDSSFADSPAKINVGEIFKMLAPGYQSEGFIRRRYERTNQ